MHMIAARFSAPPPPARLALAHERLTTLESDGRLETFAGLWRDRLDIILFKVLREAQMADMGPKVQANRLRTFVESA